MSDYKREYIDAVGGAAHSPALAIIGKLENSLVHQTELLRRWYDWARAQGHLNQCEGIANDTLDELIKRRKVG